MNTVTKVLNILQAAGLRTTMSGKLSDGTQSFLQTLSSPYSNRDLAVALRMIANTLEKDEHE